MVNKIKGQLFSGRFDELIARQKSNCDFEIGEILIAEDSDKKFFLQVYDLQYGSQISQQNLELISGMILEENSSTEFIDSNIRNYKIALLKPLITISKESNSSLSKSLPSPFTYLREITADDMTFISKPENSLFIGNLRSGSKELDVPIYLDAKNVLTHHVLITGTTGKGKSVLMKNILWELTGRIGLLVLDPHDEYYGRNNIGLKDSSSGKVVYYTSKNVPVGARSLKINITILRPSHFDCLGFSDAQEQAMNAYYREYGNKWIESIIIDKPLNYVKFNDATVNVLKRRLMYLLDLEFYDSRLFCNGIFDMSAGESTIEHICNDLENSKTVIIDTSNFSGQIELLIGSLIATEIFNKYKNYKMKGINDKPIVNIVLEEAPRVLGKDVLDKGGNVFSSIAREGRKFNVGLIAITQLPSLIPREILANINTKIILGTEMLLERQAIIESASQDISSDSRTIAALDKGECIISSNFSKFAIPIKVPFFDERVSKSLKKDDFKINFPGLN
ncbi:MAG: hypothetical protein KatS3mg002_0025 [Candidatus Woesearchaeota archaeon]|nr:MAG: hypothetical protein KatS3mg002_0025 [Candidatus Woesearchaeota archaeon]